VQPAEGLPRARKRGAECHFKNIKIKELPSTNPKPEEVAKVAEGHVSIFNGLDLKEWKTEEGSWKAGGGRLVASGKADLVSGKNFGPCELIFDYKLPAKAEKAAVTVSIGGKPALPPPPGATPGAWKRMSITAEVGSVKQPAPVVFKATEGVEIMNVFVRELKEKQ
jgi:hypothetical protein